MVKLRWEKRISKSGFEERDSASRYNTPPAFLKNKFEAAIKNSVGTKHFSAMYSIQRFYAVKGFLTEAQHSYVERIASPKIKKTSVKCLFCGSIRNVRTLRPWYAEGFCSSRCREDSAKGRGAARTAG